MGDYSNYIETGGFKEYLYYDVGESKASRSRFVSRPVACDRQNESSQSIPLAIQTLLIDNPVPSLSGGNIKLSHHKTTYA